MRIKRTVSKLISRTPLQYFPVTVRKGLAKGARWTLLPYSSYWRGQTEMDVEAAIRIHGSMLGASCWDLGTHFGIYTIGMAMAVGREGQVVGVEPNPISFKRCQRHIQMNSLGWVKLFNAAASDSEGSGSLILSGGVESSTSHFAYEDEFASNTIPRVAVRTIVLDCLVRSGEIRPADFIKVDVEGHGAKALFGARETISDNHPTLVMSFHSQWELDDTRKILEPLGYHTFTCDGREIAWQDSIFKTVIIRS